MSDRAFDSGFESLLRAALKEEAASLPLRVSPDQIMDRAKVRGGARIGSRLRLPRLSMAVAAGAGVIVLVAAGAIGLNLFVNQQGVGAPSPNSSPTPASPLPSPTPTSVLPAPTPSAPTQPIAVGPAPAGPPRAGGIALLSDGYGRQRGIMLVDPSAGDTRPLTPPLIEMLDRNGCVGETDLDIARTAGVTDMTWSPDGRALVFQLAVGQLNQSEPRPSCGLFVVSSDGQTLKRLLPAPDWEAPTHYSPAWAPDGSRIAVALRQSVALVPLDGSDLVDLGRPCDGCRPAFFASIGGWSPDGSLIAAQFVDDGCCADDTTYYIAVVDVVTAEWTLLWSGTRHEAPGGTTGYELIGWLHDGRLAASSNEGVFVAQSDEPGEWTQDPVRDTFVDPDGRRQLGVWSPDQTRAALYDSSSGDGLRVRHLTTGRIDAIADWSGVFPLTWSPDGEQLAVVRTITRELWLIEADGGNPRHVATGNGFTVAWQPVWPVEEDER